MHCITLMRGTDQFMGERIVLHPFDVIAFMNEKSGLKNYNSRVSNETLYNWSSHIR